MDRLVVDGGGGQKHVFWLPGNYLPETSDPPIRSGTTGKTITYTYTPLVGFVRATLCQEKAKSQLFQHFPVRSNWTALTKVKIFVVSANWLGTPDARFGGSTWHLGDVCDLSLTPWSLASSLSAFCTYASLSCWPQEGGDALHIASLRPSSNFIGDECIECICATFDIGVLDQAQWFLQCTTTVATTTTITTTTPMSRLNFGACLEGICVMSELYCLLSRRQFKMIQLSAFHRRRSIEMRKISIHRRLVWWAAKLTNPTLPCTGSTLPCTMQRWRGFG